MEKRASVQFYRVLGSRTNKMGSPETIRVHAIRKTLRLRSWIETLPLEEGRVSIQLRGLSVFRFACTRIVSGLPILLVREPNTL